MDLGLGGADQLVDGGQLGAEVVVLLLPGLERSVGAAPVLGRVGGAAPRPFQPPLGVVHLALAVEQLEQQELHAPPAQVVAQLAVPVGLVLSTVP